MNHFGSFDIEEYRRRIRLIRKLFGMNQTQFAAFIGVDYKKWNHYERGYPISRSSAQLLREEIPGLTVDWIWFGNEAGLDGELLNRLRQVAREDRQQRTIVPVKTSKRAVVRKRKRG